jgi:hypothetical protein
VNTYIFPHIPKTGGSSIKKTLKESSLSTYFDYEFPPAIEIAKSKHCERRNKETDLLDFHHFDIVFGHFPLSRYKKDHYSYITLLREPVERAISQYFYWKNYVPARRLALGRKVQPSANPLINDIRKGKCNFSDFLKRARINSFYERYLQYQSTHNFALVGFQNDYSAFYSEFSNLFALPAEMTEKKKENRLKEDISTKELDFANQFLEHEIRWYDQQVTIWR